jgi:hypothetical protein
MSTHLIPQKFEVTIINNKGFDRYKISYQIYQYLIFNLKPEDDGWKKYEQPIGNYNVYGICFEEKFNWEESCQFMQITESKSFFFIYTDSPHKKIRVSKNFFWALCKLGISQHIPGLLGWDDPKEA